MSESGLSKPRTPLKDERGVHLPEDASPSLLVMKEAALSIKLLGAMSVVAGDVQLALPASRKTRALLGYLILAEAPQRRERLCELFWDVPDDPRGALRWSLSKLRPIINFDGRERLQTAREQIVLRLDDVDVDVHRIRALVGDDSAPESLARAWQAATDTLLDDCELNNQPSFDAWLQLERQTVASLRASFARRLTLSSGVAPEYAIVWADRWLEDRPCDPDAAQAAVIFRRRAGRVEDALLRATELESVFRSAGLEAPALVMGASDDVPLPHTKRHVRDNTPQPLHQTVRFARTEDNASVAWASAGDEDAPALVRAAAWLTHLELDREASMWSSIYRDLSVGHSLIRYDGRGCGLSDWDVSEISFNCFVTDLETVVDAAGLGRFALLGHSEGAAVAIEYAARHPDRVSHLILFGGYPAGWRHVAAPAEMREREAVMVLTETGWGRASASCPDLFSATFMPEATQEELAWFEEFQRRTTSRQNAVRFLQAFSEIDVRGRLPELRVPTLVIHSRDDQCVPQSTGLELAAAIPGAQFICLESRNHVLIGREPASTAFTALIRHFLAQPC